MHDFYIVYDVGAGPDDASRDGDLPQSFILYDTHHV